MARNRKRRRWPWILLILVLAGGGGAYLKFKRFATPSDKPDRFSAMRLGKAEPGDIQVKIEEVGTIEPARKVEIKSNLSGKVTEFLVKEGDIVVKDQILAIVEPEISQARSLAQVQSTLVTAKNELKNAETLYRSAQQLHREGFVPKDQLDQSELNYSTALERFRAAQNDFDILKKQGIPVSQQGSGVQPANIQSPQSGIVINIPVQVGEMVMSGTSSFNSGTVLCTVADLSEMIIKAAINEIEIGKVHLNQSVKIRIDAYPRRPFNGHVYTIAPAARTVPNENVKVFDIQIAIDLGGVELRSGMTANIDIEGEKRTQVLTVPIESVFTVKDKDVVYLKRTEALPSPTPAPPPSPAPDSKAALKMPFSMKKDGAADDEWKLHFEEREVTVGLIGVDKVEILAGVTAGDEVALENPAAPPKEMESMFR